MLKLILFLVINPLFVFIIIVALGVDYSIFIMMRFKEYLELSAKEAIVLASKHIVGVVISAAIIFGGTFANIPSSINSVNREHYKEALKKKGRFKFRSRSLINTKREMLQNHFKVVLWHLPFLKLKSV